MVKIGTCTQFLTLGLPNYVYVYIYKKKYMYLFYSIYLFVMLLSINLVKAQCKVLEAVKYSGLRN